MPRPKRRDVLVGLPAGWQGQTTLMQCWLPLGGDGASAQPASSAPMFLPIPQMPQMQGLQQMAGMTPMPQMAHVPQMQLLTACRLGLLSGHRAALSRLTVADGNSPACNVQSEIFLQT